MEPISYTCVTYNVSSVPDMMLRLQKYADSINNSKLRDIFNKSAEMYSVEHYEVAQRAARDLYCALIPSSFKEAVSLSNGKKVDFICLQEFNKIDPDQEGIVQTLKELDYHLIGNKDLAIAVQREKFDILRSQKLEGEGLYVDVEDKSSSLKIRLVTDHVAGFNAKSQKEATAKLKNSQNLEEKAVKQLRETKKLGPLQGDQSLIQNIQGIIPPEPHGFINKIMEMMLRNHPTLIIYGLDANATNRHVPKEHRLHPKRLSAFDKQGFVCDETDTAPTILDLQDNTPRKYDYIYIKTTEKSTNIISTIIKAPLDHPEMCMSDHLPVVATINLCG